MENSSYGSQFLGHLQSLSKSAPYGYKELEQIKTMTQSELAEKLRTQYRPFSNIILANDPKIAAELVHQKVLEMTNANAKASAIIGFGSAGEAFAHVLQFFASAS